MSEMCMYLSKPSENVKQDMPFCSGSYTHCPLKRYNFLFVLRDGGVRIVEKQTGTQHTRLNTAPSLKTAPSSTLSKSQLGTITENESLLLQTCSSLYSYIG